MYTVPAVDVATEPPNLRNFHIWYVPMCPKWAPVEAGFLLRDAFKLTAWDEPCQLIMEAYTGWYGDIWDHNHRKFPVIIDVHFSIFLTSWLRILHRMAVMMRPLKAKTGGYIAVNIITIDPLNFSTLRVFLMASPRERFSRCCWWHFQDSRLWMYWGRIQRSGQTRHKKVARTYRYDSYIVVVKLNPIIQSLPASPLFITTPSGIYNDFVERNLLCLLFHRLSLLCYPVSFACKT